MMWILVIHSRFYIPYRWKYPNEYKRNVDSGDEILEGECAQRDYTRSNPT